MPKCDRCGSTENVQRSLVVDMPARCLKCIEWEDNGRASFTGVETFSYGDQARRDKWWEQ